MLTTRVIKASARQQIDANMNIELGGTKHTVDRVGDIVVMKPVQGVSCTSQKHCFLAGNERVESGVDDMKEHFPVEMFFGKLISPLNV